VVEYQPREWCVESKAWKLFLGSFRQTGEFHEACVTRIAQALVDLLQPEYLKVEGQFTPRGGIPFWPTFEYWHNAEEKACPRSNFSSPAPPVGQMR